MKRNSLIFLVVMSLAIIGITNSKIWAQEDDVLERKNKAEIQKVVQLKVKIKTEREEEILKKLGLECEPTENVEDSELSRREAVCDVSVNQIDQLKQAGIEFEVQREGIRIEKKRSVRRPPVWADYEGEKEDKGVVWGENGTNYSIPYQAWVYSPITISSTPAGATVYSIDVHFEVIHTYVGDLAIDLTDEDLGHEYRLWDYYGGSQDNIDTTIYMISFFIGELVNQTWKLWGYDCCAGDDGYIDYWSIQIWYHDPPDLIVQSLTASNYNPNVGDYIDVTMVIKNQGKGPAYGWFYNGLFYNLSSPPDTYTIEDDGWSTDVLDSGKTESHTFYNITSSEPGTWHMYGLADCDGGVVETNEANNHKGPITINWVQPLPDLIVQSLTLDDYSLVITEHTNGAITIKNQGPGPVMDCFYTDVFANDSSAPSPPATGEYFYESCWLDTGETICYNFYKLPHSTSAGTWSMWGLVDSWPNDWGNIHESNESNNTYGPVNITWENPPSPQQVSRPDMINHGLEFVNVNWTCSNDNVDPHWSCLSWTCDFSPGQNYTGEAYSYGGWDKPNTDFLTYLSAGLCAGSLPSNNCGQADAYWATGVDCSGLVSRCWELPARRTTSSLVYVSDQITVDALQPGDIMNRSTGEHKHVRMFYQWAIPNSWMTVIEATPKQCRRLDYNTDTLLSQGYVPRRYKWVDDPGNNDPVITGHLHCKYPQEECGDCIKHNEQMTIELDAYDPDGDPLHYVWWCYYGYFIVGGNPVPACTTYENYVIYQAPDVWWNQDQLFVDVCDNHGGDTLAHYHVEVFDPEYTCICGDANDDLIIELGDVLYLISYLYKGGLPPEDPIERGDANNDCQINLGDLTYLIAYFYRGGYCPECCWFPPEQ